MSWQEEALEDILESTRIHLSNEKPSAWYEKNMVMPRGSAFPGPFSFDMTPYWREPLDCVSPDHPAKEITIMGPAQMGKTVSVLNPIVGYTIANNPGNIMFLTGNSELTEDGVLKIDYMIDNCGLRPLIKPSVLKARNNRTGDTNTKKEFRGGDFKSGSVTNHNILRQNDVMIMIVDDYDAAPAFSKAAGSTRHLVKTRCKAFEHKSKIFWVSSPQIKGASNIEECYLLSDQRNYHVPCPCCKEMIVLKWSIAIDDKNTAGITWQLDNHGRVDKSTVGYICQKCAGFFNETGKYEMNLNGLWVPMAIPKEEDHYGYHINGLYAAPGMTGWATHVATFLQANPPGQDRNERLYQTHVNVDMGEPYEQPGTSIKSQQLQLNIRNYEIGSLPEKQSILDGNGRIVLLTCAADLGGRVTGINSDYDDVRLDYEVVAHTESGSTYSITHGSIGTFTPAHMGKKDEARELWSYDISKPNNVWKEFDKVLSALYITDTGRRMIIGITGIDTGFAEGQAFAYIDRRVGRFNIIGIKGDKDHKYIPYNDNSASFKQGVSRPNLFILKVGKLKDQLAQRISLRWDKNSGDPQPPEFMNFPQPSGGKYGLENFFLHYESEHRVLDKDNNFIWQKKTTTAQNHFWDVANYNIACKEILMNRYFKERKIDFRTATWADFCKLLIGT